ncbi:GNAT family N-acetyltransferase [Adlercreutzia sp. ZJ138]|uniref:GNAT family N-acetyltransferase n=1 Tax=Adlercreutzia sp. ZJ138 TaxID=2709405 RepID=UPI0013EC9DD1|nr:GNAT family N-acetyltransferase [Adlercreutzia sp. ZJ138]
MTKALIVSPFESSLSEKWDDFVMRKSMNGTFLQTRKFLNYHPEERFDDVSLVIWKGTSDILAVVPAVSVDSGNTFSSHPGSTFGGLVFSEQFYDIEHVDAALTALEDYLLESSYTCAVVKQSSQVFSSRRCDLLDYLLFQHGWDESDEISFVIDLDDYAEDISSNFTGSRRRGYRYGIKAGLEFREITSDEGIAEFYALLSSNLEKFGASPVHTLNELLEFKNERLRDEVCFYGSFHEGRMVSGSMVFMFNNRSVFHTQYLCASQDRFDQRLYPSNHMDANLIMEARRLGLRWFSFGISTEDHGRVLNRSLAEFKEGFGTTYCNNRTFCKELA